MTGYVTGGTIRRLRDEKKLTQKQLAEQIGVSDKAVSKWESGRGLPDISLLEPLARTLQVSIAELLSGECVQNGNRHANLLKSRFYVCPVCGNVLFASGEGSFSCCGVTLLPQECEPGDAAHSIGMEPVENELFVSMRHPMEKTHYISFFAYVTPDRVQLLKLYPEQNAEGRLPRAGRGLLYAFCNRHGLYSVPVDRMRRT